MSTVLQQTHEAAIDSARIEAFEGRLLHALNEAGMLLMTSVGHRTGLFQTLADGAPVTSESLAARAGLHERYVREWLGAMVTSGVVEIDPETNSYWLPAEHAARLTDANGMNLAVYAQYIAGLGCVEDDIVRCFHEGGGVPYERYTRFHEVMAEDSSQTVLSVLFDAILPLIPGLTERLEAGIRVLDAGCGRGMALLRMAQRFPSSCFVGYDLSIEAIAWAQARAEEAGLDNVYFEVRDLSNFDETAEPGAFDFITTFDAIHDQAKPLAVLQGICKSLAPDGVYLAQDIYGTSHHHTDRAHPLGAFLYAISCMCCMTVSLAQGGEGLGTMWGRERAREYFTKAGFGHIEVHQLSHDVQNDYWILRP